MNQVLSDSVFGWHIANGGRWVRPAGHALRLLREVVELCVACGARPEEIIHAVDVELNKAMTRDELGVQNFAAIPQEWADCAILLKVFERHAGILGDLVVQEKLNVCKLRQWEPDADGVLWRPGSIR